MHFENQYGLLYRRLHHPHAPKTANLLKGRKIWGCSMGRKQTHARAESHSLDSVTWTKPTLQAPRPRTGFRATRIVSKAFSLLLSPRALSAGPISPQKGLILMSSSSGYMHGQIFRVLQWKTSADSCRLSSGYPDWACCPVFSD